MKLVICLFIGIIINTAAVANDTISIYSQINKVTVFLKGAQVSRTAKITIPKGSRLIKFKGLSADIQAKSIQVAAGNNLTILSVSYQTNYLDNHKTEKKANLLQEKKYLAKNKIEELNADYLVYSYEENIIVNNSFSTGNQEKITAADLQKASDLYSKQLADVKIKQLQILEKRDSLQSRINIITNRLRVLNYKEKNPTGEILVNVNSNSDAETSITISYAVSDAGWFPKYDVRVSNIEKPLSLTLNANIHQSTGVSWDNVELTVSNANLSKKGIRPVLDTWFLDFYRYQANYSKYRNKKYSNIEASRTISGRVTDENGDAMPGVTVVQKDSQTRTITNLDGNYSIYIDKENALIFRYVGKETQEIGTYGQTLINTTIYPSSVELDEVVVTAIGIKREDKALGYAVTTIGGNELFQTGNSSATTTLHGKVAGVNVSGNSSWPGSSTGINIRGTSSIKGNCQPMFVIDGIPLDNSVSGSSSINDGTDFGNGINDINPESVKNIEVLKGKKATALYGSRAANGVILITTKYGLSQKNKTKKKETSVEYILEKPYTILSDNKTHSVDVKTYDIDAEYKYAAVPLMDNSVFLTAQIKDRSNYDLLTANSDLFFEGTYIGEAHINALVADTVLNFSLGKDNNIYIERKKLAEFTDKQFIGNKKEESFAYKISLRNKKTEAVNIKLEDRIPISSTNKIEIKVIELSDAELDEDTGILTWDLSLKPKETKKIIIKYSVKYPEDMLVNLKR